MKTARLFLSPLRREKSRRDSTLLTAGEAQRNLWQQQLSPRIKSRRDGTLLTVCFSLRTFSLQTFGLRDILLPALVFFTCANLSAQVTIGGLEEPKTGAILDLNSTAKGGLLLSNVVILDTEKIPYNANAFPGITTDADADVNPDFCGAMVYNTGQGTTVPAGIYIWNGCKWTKDGGAGMDIASTSPSFVTLILGNNATLSVSATGCPALSYEWFKNTVASTSNGTSTGVTTADYTTPSYTTAGTCYYYCTVSSSSNTSKVTSGLFTVKVMPTPLSGDITKGQFIAGETCFDVNAGGNSNATCGTTADREDATMNLSETYTYTFRHVTANKSLQFLLEDAAGAVELIGFSSGNGDLPSIPAGTPATALGAINAALAGKSSFEAESTYSIILKFRNTLNQPGQTPTAYGTAGSNPLLITLRAIYEDNASVIRQENRVIAIRDCYCCGINGVAETFISTTGNIYLTHQYQTGTNDTYQCWIIHGSNESGGVPANINGVPERFYTRFETITDDLCPSGWKLPTATEIYQLSNKPYLNLWTNYREWLDDYDAVGYNTSYQYFTIAKGTIYQTNGTTTSLGSWGTHKHICKCIRDY
jgi:hypothetical protein